MFSAFGVMLDQIKVMRFDAGYYKNGVWQDGDSSEFYISASVQPFPNEEQMQLPEGERNKEHIRIFTDIELKSVKQGDEGTKADRVIWNCKQYEVQKIERWEKLIEHFEIVAARVEND